MMKKIKLIALSFLMLLAACSMDSDDSDDFDASVVCPAEGTNAYGMPNRGTFVDERDGQVYKYTTIGNQVWMAENLNYDAEGSVVYDCKDSSCSQFGRYYSVKKDLIIDGVSDAELNKDLIDTLCPQGWRVPSKKEWEKLFEIMGDEEEIIARRLRSSEKIFYPQTEYPPGTDECGFQVIPSGYNREDAVYHAGFYLCSSQSFVDGLDVAMVTTYIGFNVQAVSKYTGTAEYPVRCIKD